MVVVEFQSQEQMVRKRSSIKDHHTRPHLVVTHNYHDHANDSPPMPKKEKGGNGGSSSSIVDEIHDFEAMMVSTSTTAAGAGGGGGNNNAPFPFRLYDMLETAEKEARTSNIVSWSPHGRCFVVRKPNEFKPLLPRFFKLSKIASFQRQLNLYGFQRITRGRDKGGYYHEVSLFLLYK